MRHLSRLILGTLGTGLLLLSAPAAIATQGAHFFSASASVSSSGALLLSWDEAGVGQQQVDYSGTIPQQSATYACFNKGGNHPQASNKEGPAGPTPVDLGPQYPDNGRVRVRNFPVPGTPLASTLSCPSGQTRYLVNVTYAGSFVLTDDTNNVSTTVTLPGCVSFDTKNFPC